MSLLHQNTGLLLLALNRCFEKRRINVSFREVKSLLVVAGVLTYLVEVYVFLVCKYLFKGYFAERMYLRGQVF